MHNRPLLLASTLSAALVGGALVHGLDHGAAKAAPPARPAVADSPMADARPQPTVPPSALVAAPPPAPAATRPSSRFESLSQKVDRLGRSPDPVDAFAAYQLVTACVWARDHEGWMAHHILPGDRALLPTPQQACGDIASDQVQSRLRWLERAALAGVHHAATEMLREGPDGLGPSNSDIDAPENASWKLRVGAALDAGVRTCDPDSLESRINAYESGQGVAPDRAMALTYWVAYMECRQRLVGQPGSILSNADSVTQRMGRSLTADQVAQAMAAGHALARDARPLPGDR
ncbi:MAG: hypothetical protein JF586_01640 [Burkholderiales bacterium]|nr:hypothetical protein [Burkholderiales bacterium]